MTEYILTKSKNKDNKYALVIKYKDKQKTINFGDKQYEDFTIHKDSDRK